LAPPRPWPKPTKEARTWRNVTESGRSRSRSSTPGRSRDRCDNATTWPTRWSRRRLVSSAAETSRSKLPTSAPAMLSDRKNGGTVTSLACSVRPRRSSVSPLGTCCVLIARRLRVGSAVRLVSLVSSVARWVANEARVLRERDFRSALQHRRWSFSDAREGARFGRIAASQVGAA
jgi:hypothetical protein